MQKNMKIREFSVSSTVLSGFHQLLDILTNQRDTRHETSRFVSCEAESRLDASANERSSCSCNLGAGTHVHGSTQPHHVL